MLFHTAPFGVFLVVVVTAAWALADRPRARTGLLLIASYWFYASWDLRYAALIGAVTFVDFVGALWLSRLDGRARQALVSVVVGLNLGCLGYFKYANFFLENLGDDATATRCRSTSTSPATPTWRSAPPACSASACRSTSTRPTRPPRSSTSGAAGTSPSRASCATTSTSRSAATASANRAATPTSWITMLLGGLWHGAGLDIRRLGRRGTASAAGAGGPPGGLAGRAWRALRRRARPCAHRARLPRVRAVAVILDAGALIAVEAGDRAMMARLVVAQTQGEALRTHAMVVAQVWREARGRQALLARLLRCVAIVAVDDALGRRAGELLGRSHTSDPIDAAVVLIARERETVVTSDPDDLRRLAAAVPKNLRIVAT
jgi:hypothetical protein